MLPDNLRGKVMLIAGMESLIPLLKNIGIELAAYEEDSLSKRVQNQVTPKSKKRARKSTK